VQRRRIVPISTERAKSRVLLSMPSAPTQPAIEMGNKLGNRRGTWSKRLSSLLNYSHFKSSHEHYFH
jgi:hypothetical protein